MATRRSGRRTPMARLERRGTVPACWQMSATGRVTDPTHTGRRGTIRTCSAGFGAALPRGFDLRISRTEDGRMAWPTRVKIGRRTRRSGEHDEVSELVVINPDGSRTVATLHALIGWSDDTERMWVGHSRQMSRHAPASAHRGKGSERRKRAARAITAGQLRQMERARARRDPAIENALSEALSTLQVGTSSVVTLAVPLGTVTLAPSGQLTRWTLTKADGSKVTGRAVLLARWRHVSASR